MPDPAPAELGALLNQAVLHLSPAVQVKSLAPDRVALKFSPGRRYLVVTPQQWEVLQLFKQGRTVTSVLCDLIAGQRCPSLRELYELVVQAARAGILSAEGYPVPPDVPPTRWRLRLPGRLGLWLTLVAAVGAVAVLIWHPISWFSLGPELLLGWLAVSAAASLGTILAASVVHAAGKQVYRPYFLWKTALPRWHADLDDTLMGGRDLAVNTALVQLAPPFLLLGLAAWRWPSLGFPLLIGVLLLLCPFWRSPLRELVDGLYREFRLATAGSPIFGDAGNWRIRLARLLRAGKQPRYFFAWGAASLLWAGLTVAAVASILPDPWRDRLGWRPTLAGAQQAGLYLGLALGVMLALVCVGLVVWLGYRLYLGWRERAERALRPAAVLVSPQTIAEWLGRTVVFRDLPAEELAALAAVIKPEEHKRGSFVVREGEPGECLYIVLSGRLEVRRNYAPGRSEPVAEMGEGEVFGEIALLQGGVRTRSIRSLGRSVLLTLAKADFERLVLTKLSRQAVEDAVQKVGFLQRTELTRNWSQTTMAEFARRSKLLELPEGAVVLKAGERNHWFFLLHRGELAVRLQDREIRRLKQGDSFGELSLVSDGVASASVVVRSKLASCLVIPGRDFLEFITHDFAVGLKWDELRTKPREKNPRQPR